MNTLSQLVIDENNMVFHPEIGNSYKVNDIGKDILLLLREGKSKYQVIETLLTRYEIEYNYLFIDVSDYFAKLRVYGLVR